ncbi:MAG: hypothetical protein QM642_11020, partial [Edaphocola sp.]
MAQPKGSTGNPHGRPKGTPNKVSSEIREKIALFLAANIDGMQDCFDRVEKPETKLLLMEKLFGYITPKGHGITLEKEDAATRHLPDWATGKMQALPDNPGPAA